MTSYRTIVPNGHGGGTTYRDHVVNPTTDGADAVRIADAMGGFVEVSDNGVTGWEFYYAPDVAPTRDELAATRPAVEVVASFAVCVDCMQFVTGVDAHERGEDYPQAVIDAMTAPDAADWHLVNACGDDCEGTCETFSYAPCDTCASWLAGERHAVTALSA